MRLSRLVAVFCAVFALSVEAASAAPSHGSASRYAVTLRGSVTKVWTYTRASLVNGCRTRVNGSGTRRIALRSSDVSIVAARWSGGKSRARFSGKVVVSGSTQQSGTKTTTVGTGAGCETGTHRTRCQRVYRSFANQPTGLVSRRLHRLSLLRVPGLVSSDFDNGCPGEPANIKAISGNVELAGATYSEATLVSTSTAGLTLQGKADITTRLYDPIPGNVVQHVRWTLLLRRVGA